MRGGYADYRHNEVAEDGAINTTFNSTGGEARLELVQRERNGWKGAIGGQYVLRKVDIVGAEKFLPAIKTQQFGLFTVQSVDLGTIRAEAGGRIEHASVSAAADAAIGNLDTQRSLHILLGIDRRSL